MSKSIREKIGKVYIAIVFALWLGTEVLFNSTIKQIFFWDKNEANSIMAVVILVMLMIHIILFQSYKWNEALMIILLSIPILIATINSDHNTMMSTWVFIVASKDVDFNIISTIAFYVQLIMIVTVVYLFYNGFIDEVTVYRGDILRHSLGFTHPNQLGIRLFLLIVLWCYLRRKRLGILDLALLIGAAVFVKKVTDSQTPFYALIIFTVILSVHLVTVKIGYDINKLSGIYIWITVFVCGLSIFMSSIKINRYKVLAMINNFMSHRFSECRRTLRYYGIKWFGQDVKLFVSKPVIGRYYHFWLDNAFMSILLRYGIVVLVIFMILYINTMRYLKLEGQTLLVEILCLFAIYGVMENNFYSMSQNLFLILLSYPLYNYASQKSHLLKRQIRFVW